MRFTVFLTQRGWLTATQCVQVLSVICERTPPIGKLAIRERFLSLQQVAALLHNVPDRTVPLGKLAQQAGLLSEAQRRQLVEAQYRATPKAADVVVELGFMSRDAVEREHRAFLASM